MWGAIFGKPKADAAQPQAAQAPYSAPAQTLPSVPPQHGGSGGDAGVVRLENAIDAQMKYQQKLEKEVVRARTGGLLHGSRGVWRALWRWT